MSASSRKGRSILCLYKTLVETRGFCIIYKGSQPPRVSFCFLRDYEAGTHIRTWIWSLTLHSPSRRKIFSMIIQENILLAPHTVFKIGGPARYFCEVKSTDELHEALMWTGRHATPFFILGAGSNVLASDEGFAGLAIKMNLRAISVSDSFLNVEAGVPIAQAVSAAMQHSLGGFEWGIGIPGTIGGSVFGNAGCFG